MEKLKLNLSHYDSVLITSLIKAHLMLVGMRKIKGFELLFIAQLGEVNVLISKKTLFTKDNYDLKLDMASVYALFHLLRFTGIEERVQLSKDEINRLNIILAVLDRFLTPIMQREAKQHFDTTHESIGWPSEEELNASIQLSKGSKPLDSYDEEEPRKEAFGWKECDNEAGGFWSIHGGEDAYHNALLDCMQSGKVAYPIGIGSAKDVYFDSEDMLEIVND